MPLLAASLDQLEPGDLKIERSTVSLPELTLRRTRLSLGVRATGTLNGDGALVALVVGDSSEARWSGEPFGDGNVASTRSQFDLFTRGPATVYTLSVKGDALPRDFLAFDPARAARFRRYLDRLLAAADRKDALTETRHSAGKSLLAFLSRLRDADARARTQTTRRVAAVRQCEAYIFDHIEENPTLADLSSITGLRVRSLINAFLAVTGYSPMAYLKAQRLNAAHRALRARNPKTKVIDVAANWGFWHMGHFTAAYRTMFGETPSQTLGK